jgi:CopG family transcriptional regulator, nickel-responsive regulator
MAATELNRFSLSMAAELIRKLDQMVRRKGFANRSQAVSELVRAALVEDAGTQGSHEIAGTVTLVYDHHRHELQARLTEIQHDHGALIIAAMHVHLDHHHCLETLVVRGKADAVRHLAERLIAVKGVIHGKLTVTTTGKEFHG